MTLLRRVRRLIGVGDVVYECRQCGTTLQSSSDDCPNCGADDTAEYRIE